MRGQTAAIDRIGDCVSDRRRRRNAWGECCVRLADGTFATDAFHEQIVEWADDSDIQARTQRFLLDGELTRQPVDPMFPDLVDDPSI
jgi:hypothetical protein